MTAAGPHPWIALIPDDEWQVYQPAIAAAIADGVPFALGGAFALAAHTGRWRDTKDLDFFVTPADRERMIAILDRLGLADYAEQEEYDRGWIYRGHRDGIIVDVIWSTANRHAEIDQDWIECGPVIDVRGEQAHVLPVEELVWAKTYVFHRDRCDWTDVLNLIYSAGQSLDWERLLERFADDALLLTGVLSVFTWLCPARARLLPAWLWERLPRPKPGDGPEIDVARINLLDTRPWFFPLIEDPMAPAPAIK